MKPLQFKQNLAEYTPIELTRYSSEMEYLMMPFAEKPDFQWETLDAVAECVNELNDKDKVLIMAVFYDRKTYEELTEVANVKAKSHAWKNTRRAMMNLKKIMEAHPELQKYKDKNETGKSPHRPSSAEATFKRVEKRSKTNGSTTRKSA
jgi:hypothetical protein